MYYIGIDLGTSAVKLLLADEKGAIVKTVTKEYPLIFPHPGWSEQDPAEWWKAVSEGIGELLKGADAAEVAGIGAGVWAGFFGGFLIAALSFCRIFSQTSPPTSS